MLKYEGSLTTASPLHVKCPDCGGYVYALIGDIIGEESSLVFCSVCRIAIRVRTIMFKGRLYVDIPAALEMLRIAGPYTRLAEIAGMTVEEVASAKEDEGLFD